MCIEFTEMALLCMLVGASRWAGRKTCMPSPCSACIEAPTWRATTLTQLGSHRAKALVSVALAMFWLICRTTLALL